jgi:HNH endonuclease
MKAKLMACVVCKGEPCDPAHVIPRGLLTEGQDDPRAVIPLCRGHHDAFDHGDLSLLAYLEPYYRPELAFAVQRFGLVSTLRAVTNDRAAAEAAA